MHNDIVEMNKMVEEHIKDIIDNDELLKNMTDHYIQTVAQLHANKKCKVTLLRQLFFTLILAEIFIFLSLNNWAEHKTIILTTAICMALYLLLTSIVMYKLNKLDKSLLKLEISYTDELIARLKKNIKQ